MEKIINEKPIAMMEDDHLLSPQQVAFIFNVHVNTVKRIPPEELPYYALLHRGDRKYRMGDIQKYLEQHLVVRRG